MEMVRDIAILVVLTLVIVKGTEAIQYAEASLLQAEPVSYTHPARAQCPVEAAKFRSSTCFQQAVMSYFEFD